MVWMCFWPLAATAFIVAALFLAVFIVFFPLTGIVVVELPAFHGTVLLINRLDVCQPLIKRVGGACPRTALLTLG